MPQNQEELNSAMLEACKYYRFPEAKRLIKQGADWHATYPDGTTMLTIIPCYRRAFQLYDRQGRTVYDQSKKFFTVEKQALNLVKQAIKAGVNVNATGDKGWNAVFSAAMYGNVAILEELRKAGAKPDVPCDGITPLMAARANKQEAAIAYLEQWELDQIAQIKNNHDLNTL